MFLVDYMQKVKKSPFKNSFIQFRAKLHAQGQALGEGGGALLLLRSLNFMETLFLREWRTSTSRNRQRQGPRFSAPFIASIDMPRCARDWPG
jgi:hypothetical protein